MDLAQSLILSIIQGLTEFLPVSSSGHLNLFQHFFGLTPSLSFDVLLNTATLFSVLFFFRSQVRFFIDNLGKIIIASLPAGLIGVLFKSSLEQIFANFSYLSYFFLITSILLLSSYLLKPANNSLTYKRALLIGFFQALAILPGVSRAGSTIFAGLLLGLSPVTAFNFSFALFIPASLGALLLSLKDIGQIGLSGPIIISSLAVTFIVGVFALKLLRRFVISRRLWPFGLYTLILAIILFLVS
ncbi:MAG: undecaprenyl-diphosphate phosphatase [Candidatus Shapirobacteria bacterium]|jgi:undecaprenyl-diphosphatase